MTENMTSKRPEIVFATGNAHKLEEAQKVVGDSYRLLSLKDIGCEEDIPETGATLQENAFQKARWVKQHYGYNCFADDTGLMVDALDGAPGVMSARYAGAGHDAAANMKKLLHEMEGKENRKAHFSTVIALIAGDKEMCVEGRVDGRITMSARGTNGFGYDPVFEVENTSLTFAEMDSSQKNEISHRGRAMRKLMEILAADTTL